MSPEQIARRAAAIIEAMRGLAATTKGDKFTAAMLIDPAVIAAAVGAGLATDDFTDDEASEIADALNTVADMKDDMGPDMETDAATLRSLAERFT